MPNPTPGPWEAEHHPERQHEPEYWSIEAPVIYPGAKHGGVVADTLNRDCTIDPDTDRANAQLLAAAPDCVEMLRALIFYGWSVEKRSLFDEEGIEGWAWVEPNGTEHTGIGDWNEMPPWPDSARAALAKREGR